MATHTLHADPRIVDLDIGGMKPFWSARHAAEDCLAEAHAMLTFMAAALEMSEGLGDQTFKGARNGEIYENSIRTLRDSIKAQSLNGVARLVATALHCNHIAFGEAA
ncbi:hypothetical protein [Sphingopyxis sp. 113P3]|uniref:hypothetical protein n=1 Tax=Sphingopyxis sp. (strain 113P3) TaxID=292913 RepID=UPI0006AD3CA0|nr:hypothetical protein [Sphingopyxis sp. 113P3]ALC12473.1 hypothetical protein LH20_10975 [Sphingopyxis sp. 113P3]